LHPGPSMLATSPRIWTYPTLISIGVKQDYSTNTQHALTTLPKILHSRTYLLCRSYDIVQSNTERLHKPENSGKSALLKRNADLKLKGHKYQHTIRSGISIGRMLRILVFFCQYVWGYKEISWKTRL
jgi:hypothetical protein